MANYSSTLIEGLRRLRRTSTLVDFTIKVKGKEYPCHKTILAALSPYFDAMFAVDMRESMENAMSLDLENTAAFENILEYMYSGVVNIDEYVAMEMMYMAGMFQMDDLFDECERRLERMEKPVIVKVAELWKTAQLHELHQTTTKLRNVILRDFRTVSMTKGFLQHLTSEDVISLISDDSVNVDDDGEILKAVIKWVDFSREERSFCELLKCIKLTDTCKRDLETVHPLEDCPKCRQLLIEDEFLPGAAEQQVSRVDGGLFVFGGDNMLLQNIYPVHCFSWKSRKWFVLTPLETSMGIGAAICLVDRHVFISGGAYRPTDFQVYSIEEDRWRSFPEMTQERRKHCLVADTSSMLNIFMYAVGGTSGPGVFLSSIERYDPGDDSWEQVGELTIPTANAAASVNRHNLLVYGGLTSGFKELDTIQCFDLRNSICSVIRRFTAPIAETRLFEDNSMGLAYIVSSKGNVYEYNFSGAPEEIGTISGFPRENFGLAAMKRKLVIVGGTLPNFETTTDIIQYDLDTRQTTTLDDSLPLTLEGFSCVSVEVARKHLTKLWSADLVKRF